MVVFDPFLPVRVRPQTACCGSPGAGGVYLSTEAQLPSFDGCILPFLSTVKDVDGNLRGASVKLQFAPVFEKHLHHRTSHLDEWFVARRFRVQIVSFGSKPRRSAYNIHWDLVWLNAVRKDAGWAASAVAVKL